MGARLIASFSRADVEALGDFRWGELRRILTPALNILAGATVWFQAEGDMIHVLAPPGPDAQTTWPVTDISEAAA